MLSGLERELLKQQFGIEEYTSDQFPITFHALDSVTKVTSQYVCTCVFYVLQFGDGHHHLPGRIFTLQDHRSGRPPGNTLVSTLDIILQMSQWRSSQYYYSSTYCLLLQLQPGSKEQFGGFLQLKTKHVLQCMRVDICPQFDETRSPHNFSPCSKSGAPFDIR